MKKFGWESHDDLTTRGWGNEYGYSIWFERHNWHGRNTYALTGHGVTFHRHISDLSQIDYITKICAEQAIQAYEDFADCVPFQNAKNETAKDIMLSDWNDERTFIKKAGT